MTQETYECGAALSRIIHGHIHRCVQPEHAGLHRCECGHTFSNDDIVHELDD